MSQPVEKKKRGRKKAVKPEESENVNIEVEKPAPKKRGRKPKGGKIISNNNLTNIIKENEPNVILHLKCNLTDIHNPNFQESFQYNPSVEPIESFNFENKTFDNFLIDSKDDSSDENTTNKDEENENSLKTIWKKITSLKIKLHKNNIQDKRSSCFWCTCDFDNPPIFIPKYEFKKSFHVYGCFCSPQCAVAYLMDEKIDSTIKFERYHLINHIYGKIFNYEKNIKPAPSPYYLLDKYYGNLSITQYRELFKNDQLLIVVEKPLTHVFPELYEDNSEFIINQRTIPTSNNLKLKRNSVKTPTVLENMTNKN